MKLRRAAAGLSLGVACHHVEVSRAIEPPSLRRRALRPPILPLPLDFTFLLSYSAAACR